MEEEERGHDKNETIINVKNDKTKTSFHKQIAPKNGYEPITSLLCQFDQIIVQRLLHHHIQSITNEITNNFSSNNGNGGLSRQRGKWIYALLARLEKPLHRDDEASSLSTLLRELCRLRSELSVDDLQK